MHTATQAPNNAVMLASSTAERRFGGGAAKKFAGSDR